MADVMIEARELTKRYGHVRALNQVSFEVRKGEVLGFLGPNGAGKTTTMKILTCFIAPTSGSARVNGYDVLADPLDVRRALGYLPESTPLYTEMLVLEYLQFVARMRGLSGEKARQAIKRVVEQTSLGDVIGKTIGQLSKGYRQRVGLAQALIHEPPILILDEPMSGLDPNQATEIRELIKDIGKERTVILSTHNLAEVQVTCGRVLIVANGKIVADDDPESLKARAGRPRFVATVLRTDANGASRDRALSVLKSVPGAQSVQALSEEQNEIEVEVLPTGDEDLRADIFGAAVKNNLVLLGLERRSQNLEQVFRQLTTSDAPDASSTEPPSAQADASAQQPEEPPADKPNQPRA